MMRGYASGGYVGNAASPASVSWRCDGQHGGVYISSGSEQQSTQRSAIDSNGILKQLKPAIISVVSEQAQRPGTPLCNKKEGLSETRKPLCVFFSLRLKVIMLLKHSPGEFRPPVSPR
jgi:hypothetical protein